MLMRPTYSDAPAQRWHAGDWLLDSSAIGRTVLCPPTEQVRYLMK
jgi:hypothetical protein